MGAFSELIKKYDSFLDSFDLLHDNVKKRATKIQSELLTRYNSLSDKDTWYDRKYRWLVSAFCEYSSSDPSTVYFIESGRCGDPDETLLEITLTEQFFTDDGLNNIIEKMKIDMELYLNQLDQLSKTSKERKIAELKAELEKLERS